MNDKDSFCHFCGKLKDKYDPPFPETFCGQCAQARDKGDHAKLATMKEFRVSGDIKAEDLENSPGAVYEFDQDNVYQAQRDQEAVDNYVGF